MASNSCIQPSDLWEAFSYDPFTGNLYRLTGPSKTKKAGCLRKDGYTVVWFKGKLWLAHRLIYVWHTGVDPQKLYIDHVNRNCTDNRICNLRAATAAQSSFNTVGTGVYKRKNGKFSAKINKNYKPYYLGTFDSREEAVAAYKAASIVLHGEFGCVE
jgi:hypothetical protein